MNLPPLDVLYGVGAARAFREGASMAAIFPGSALTVETSVTAADSSVHLELTWKTGGGEVIARCSQDCHPQRIHYTNLIVSGALNAEGKPLYRGKGLYRQLILGLLELYKSWGIHAITASPATARSEYILILGGFHWQTWEGHRWFIVRVDIPCQMEEYRAWVAAGEPPEAEPQWHKECREHPVGGLEEL